jgi:hypothetical protein
MNWKKSACGILATVVMSLPSLKAWGESLAIPAGTPVIVQLAEEVNSGTHKKGDRVKLSVVSDVVVQGKTVIKAGTAAEGTVESAAKRFFAGIGGQIEISVDNTKAVDGTTVPLQFKKETHGGSSLVSIVLTLVCCCCFVFIPGENVKIDKGTIFNATVLGPTETRV